MPPRFASRRNQHLVPPPPRRGPPARAPRRGLPPRPLPRPRHRRGDSDDSDEDYTMPAQRRPAPTSSAAAADVGGDGSPPPQATVDQQEDQQEGMNPPPHEHPDDSVGEGGVSPGSDGEDSDDEYILVNLADIRKEVQCPICLGIIRKTRTVMECLHRFCRECIDKSMRLGNNECPACRTHCASRRSLRDDPKYDTLIATLYPDIDKFEEEEFAFHEEEKTRNRKIQESIAETFRRQTEALGRKRSSAKATAAAFVRRSRGNFGSSSLRSRGRSGGGETSAVGSDNDDEADENGNEGSKDSSAEERSPELGQKRTRRFLGPRSSPVRAAGNSNMSCEENEDLEVSRETLGTSPLRVGHREMLVWGKGGARSQTRHGGLNKNKGGRMAKLVKYLRSLDENDDELDVHLTLLPMDEQHTPVLEQRYLCCRPTVSVRHLCEFIAIHTSAQVEQVELLVRKPQGGTSSVTSADSVGKAHNDPSEGIQILGPQESLSRLFASFASNHGDLVLLYRLKNAKLDESTS